MIIHDDDRFRHHYADPDTAAGGQLVGCPWNCGMSPLSARAMYMHQIRCPMRQMTCDCGRSVLFRDMGVHRSRLCPNRIGVVHPLVQNTLDRLACAACKAQRAASLASARAAVAVVCAAVKGAISDVLELSEKMFESYHLTKMAFANQVRCSFTGLPDGAAWVRRADRYVHGHCDHMTTACDDCQWLDSIAQWHTKHECNATADQPCDFLLCQKHVIPCFWPSCNERFALQDRDYHMLLCSSKQSACFVCGASSVLDPAAAATQTRGTRRMTNYAALMWKEKKMHSMSCGETDHTQKMISEK
jgi:hypothetical protein